MNLPLAPKQCSRYPCSRQPAQLVSHALAVQHVPMEPDESVSDAESVQHVLMQQAACWICPSGQTSAACAAAPGNLLEVPLTLSQCGVCPCSPPDSS